MTDVNKNHVNELPEVQIITLGNENVGKTSIIRRFSEDQFSLEYKNTIGVDYINKIIKIDQQNIRVKVWDTAGQEKFRTITKAYYHKADGIFIVFDVTSRDTFEANKGWINSINEFGNGHSKIVLVGNKCDLERSVSEEEAQVFAYDNGIKYFDTSAKEGTNINEVFEFLAKEALQNKPIIQPIPDPDPKSCFC